ncbi:sporulation membrane protein YtaF [Cohnella terricola]|uniref:Sporulation membrane protein YtaF n=1 Tax=Cohnella terricola TaxID=1289167 RepID=A0A559JQW2_9BACL|nr:sporulation membrane protein YtaF [Cohnella terricola]TVY02266.1 sporulation membrane protein YtaF [Cohnella terricola]
MLWLLILGFAISSSLDNLGVGISYGIRGIKIGTSANLIIAAVCLLFSYGGIVFGKWLSSVLPGLLPVFLSTIILLVIGVRIILLAAPRQRSVAAAPQASKGLAGVLRNPESVDLDGSQDIGIVEAIILGAALSANALTNGLSAGLLGLSPFSISLTAALGSFLTVWFGVWIGGKAANVRVGPFTLGQFGTLFSGIILVLIALNNFW